MLFIYHPKRDEKFKCPKCGTEFSVKMGGYGDCPRDIKEMGRLARDIFLFKNLRCPECGSKINLNE